MRSCTIPCLMLAVLSYAGCGIASVESAQVTRLDSAGIEIVSNMSNDRVLNWHFEREWILGGAGDDRLAVAELARHAVGADSMGRAYVLDTAARRVLIISRTGLVVDSLGRPGPGPGELEQPEALSVDLAGNVAVYDRAKAALVRWSAAGALLNPLRIAADVIGPAVALTASGVMFTGFDADRPGPDHQRLMAWTDSSQQTLARMTRLPYHRADFPSCGLHGVNIAPLFAPELVWQAVGNRVAVSSNTEYVVDIIEAGRLRRSVRRSLAPRPVTEAMALRQVGNGVFVAATQCTIPATELVAGRGYAQVMPSVKAVALSPGGELWVQRAAVADESSPIDVFTNAGEYLGLVALSAPFPAVFIAEDRILATEVDSLGVAQLGAYRVRRQ